MSVNLVTGPPGSGKTLYAMRVFRQAITRGKVVAGNVELRPDWSHWLARSAWAYRLRGRKAVDRRAQDLDLRHHFSTDLQELFSIRLRGQGEGRGVMILDEAHMWLNSRRWSEGGRDDVIRFFTQHRKLGWDVYLITQDEGMLDKQVRGLYEYHVQLKNLRKFKWHGIPLSPVNTFVAVWTWYGVRISHQSVVKRELYTVGSTGKLYNTFQTLHGLDQEGDDGAIWLPRRPDTAPTSYAAGDGRASGPHGADEGGTGPAVVPDASGGDRVCEACDGIHHPEDSDTCAEIQGQEAA